MRRGCLYSHFIYTLGTLIVVSIHRIFKRCWSFVVVDFHVIINITNTFINPSCKKRWYVDKFCLFRWICASIQSADSKLTRIFADENSFYVSWFLFHNFAFSVVQVEYEFRYKVEPSPLAFGFNLYIKEKVWYNYCRFL